MERPGGIAHKTNEVLALERVLETPRVPATSTWVAEFDDDEGVSAKQYVYAIQRRWWLIVLTTLLGTCLTAVYVARKPDIYQAEASIQIDAENNPAIGARNGSSVVINTNGDPAYYNTQLLMLKSPALLRRVVKTLNLEKDGGFTDPRSVRANSTWQGILGLVGMKKDPAPVGEGGDNLLRAASIAPASPDEDMAEARRLAPYVATLNDGLKVDFKDTTRLLNVTFTHEDPRVTARVVNATVDAFVQSTLERRTKSTADAGQFLQKRIAELQSNIRTNEERLISFARQHKVTSLDAGNATTDRLAKLAGDLLVAENARKAAEHDYNAALQPGAAASLVDGSGNNLIPTLESKIADLQQRRDVMLLEAGENWPEVKQLEKQISGLEQQLGEVRQRASTTLVSSLEMRFRQASAREQSLREALNEQQTQALSLNETAINYRMIQQETTTYKTMLDGLLQRSKENDLILAETPNNVHVVDYAIAGGTLVGPKRLRFVGLSLAFSFAVGLGLAILLGHFDDTLRINSVEEVERLFGLPALAAIPTTAALVKGRTFPSFKALRGSNGHDRSATLLALDARSPLSESFRQLRTAILLSAGGGPAPGRILFTSSLPSEGKTTSVVNTALLLSQTGAKVLIIDADLRHPTVHKIFNMENRRGLSTVLSSETSEIELFDTIEKYKDTQLYVLPSGPVPDNPAELLSSERMRQFLNTFDTAFTHVLIDSPPIAYFTDGVVLSSMVDNVLLVVNGQKGSRQVTQHSLQLMQSAGARILGVVLNDVNLRSHKYTYYQEYYRQLDEAKPTADPSR